MEKLKQLRHSFAIEADTSRKFQLEHQIREEEEQLAQLETQLSETENQPT
jgi:hypothetical protein